MNKNNTLLFDPPHILPPDVVLVVVAEMRKLWRCIEVSYIVIGIPPSPLMIAAFINIINSYNK
jgi:coenzyme F420-reducing hydrogenase gamma subunit